VKKILNRCVTGVLMLIIMMSTASFSRRPTETDTQIAVANPPHVSNQPVTDDTYSLGEDAAHHIVGISNDEFRAVWVTTVLNLDFPSQQALSADAMKQEIDAIVAHTAALGLNAIIFQVRPTGDAFYESNIFPWSQWLSGTQGQGIPDFDPLAYWIEASHAKGIELHAWINPYRIIHTITNSSDPNTLAPNHPVRLRPELAVGWTDPNGRQGLFLDPGLPEARQLIFDGIADLVRNYHVDGIHIDDYFYPGTDFDDAASFARYGNGMDLHDWRRENVNELIKGIQSVIRALNDELGRNVRWGVSPTAIWKNESSNPYGVPTTRGMESYHTLYADTRRWVMEEWVDYINPQIYWYIGFEIADFEAVFNWWVDLCRGTNVDLYIGHAAWREDLNHQPPRWDGEMVRQLEMVAACDVTAGSVFFRFESLQGAVGNAIRNFYMRQGRQPIMVLDTLTVGTPQQDTTLTAASASGFHITGTSDPYEILYMNGAVVLNRTVEGFFSVFAPLDAGVNVFTFSQAGQDDVTRRITLNAPGTPDPPAPAATVTQITTPTYATVTDGAAWVFPGHTTAGGSDWMLLPGQQDRVIAESSNGFVRLSNGMWINRNHVTLRTENAFIENVLRNGVYHAGAYYDMIVWQSDMFPAAYAGFDGQTLTIYFGMHTEAPPLTLPANLSETMFSSVRSGMHGITPYHAFTIRDDVRFEGHFIDFDNGEFRLHLRRRRTLTPGDMPLVGITIVLDPGHGGEEYGAIGPLGGHLSEKDLTLINSLKLAERLTALGANVHLTRDDDTTVTLQERVDLSWRVMPDLFISLHVNSVAETTNAANISGFTVWYRNAGSVNISRIFLDFMHDINPATTRYRNINQANFFVCRPQWVPSVILESGFIVNIDDFVWLIDPVMQDKMADAMVESILSYFIAV